MGLIKVLRKSFYLCETFGLISFEIQDTDRGKLFLESARRLKLSRINFASVALLHSFLVIFSTEEIRSAKEDLSVKIVRFCNLMAFSGGIAAMFLVVTTKGKLVCEGLNELNDLYVSLSSERPISKKVKSNGPLFLGTVANYLVTVLPLMLTALYVQRAKISKVMSYSYYGYSMWLENIFVYQFVTVARFAAQIYAIVTHIYMLPEMSDEQILLEIRRSRKHEEIVKKFIDVLIDVYKYVLFFWICWSFTMILQFVLKVNLRIRVLIWCLFICIRVISIIYGCTVLKKETEKAAGNLYKKFVGIDDARIKEEIELYSYQLLHRKPKFNALGFFTIDFPLFHSMIASVATYIIILTQLKGSSGATNTKI